MPSPSHLHYLCGLDTVGYPCDKEECSPESVAQRWEEMINQVREILPSFSEVEQKIIEMRFGLVDNVCHTLEEVGEEFGVTRERIRQIEAKALEKIAKTVGVDRL